jgi:hypothetical protein
MIAQDYCDGIGPQLFLSLALQGNTYTKVNFGISSQFSVVIYLGMM